MIPEGLATLYAFLGLVAPGLVFQFVRERARPALEESAFREASRVAFTSLVFTTASILALALLSRAMPGAFVDLSEWMQSDSEYVGDHFWLVASSLVAEVGLACLIAWAVAKALATRVDKNVTHSKESVWYLTIIGSRPKGKVAWVSAHLMDDTKVWGFVHHFTSDLRLENRELSLRGPGLAIQRPGKKRRELEFDYLVIPGSEIRRMKVAYQPAAESAHDEPAAEPAEGSAQDEPVAEPARNE